MINDLELRKGNFITDINAYENAMFPIMQISETRVFYGKRKPYMSMEFKGILPIPLTEDILINTLGFEKIPHFTVTNSLIFNIGRMRYLSIGCVGTPNEMLWLCVNDEYGLKVTDLICLHNFDYDGKLYLHKLQNIISDFSSNESKK